MPEETRFQELKRYVRFDARDAELLVRFRERAEPEFPRIALEFYDRIREHGDAHAVFTGEEQILCGVNSGALKTYAVKGTSKYITPPTQAVYAIVKLISGHEYRQEFYHGDSYLSQSSRTLRVGYQVRMVDFYDSRNEKIDTRILLPR